MLKLLQPLVFPHSAPVSGADALYVKGTGKPDKPEPAGRMMLPAGEKLEFSTYFNLFSAAKWRRWTGAEKLQLALRGSGRCKAEITGHNIKTGRNMVVAASDCNLEDAAMLLLPGQVADNGHDVFTLSVTAINHCIITGGGWYADVPLEREIRAAVVICTFNREQYLWPNVDVLTAHLPDGWKVFIINQGEAFTAEYTEKLPDCVSVFKNPNLGGSGGFTRGLIEALQAEDSFTHALLMDDDIRIEPAVIDKTNRLLRHLKPEYHRHFTAGAMLRMDTPAVQHECGARWSGFRVRHSFHNYELNKAEDLLKNESLAVFNKEQYAAWWYCTVPLEPEMLNDLPLPFFVNGDDIEYSMRRAPGLLRLNGIAVWHEAFELKASKIKRYLTVRNGLINNVRAGFPFIMSFIFVAGRWFRALLQRAPEDRAYIKLAVEHFLEGPERLWQLCGPQLFEIKPESKKNHTIIGLLLRFIRYYRKAQREYRKVNPNTEDWKGLNNV